ncbi:MULTISPECIES: hypothetical protein [Sphingobacterium]|uniref:DUF4377 domain-containing protein n=1 Tax=Sphingobacterium litopenaei TaxID=2763500 RepID=A0ABR7YCP1_9SPHI|nr:MULTISPECIES: hypothetical protein [Sphingobacterium]MBD1429062.1 hypothetical protein [Sphingobacterium litopenaei]NGM72409.1 hypothetical protein [Sphingobacterium sp. SGL-16]
MKRVLLALAIASASLVTLSSCTKEYITNYLPGVTYTTTVKPNDWVRDGNTNIYYTDLEFPELDNAYYNYGTVQVHLEFTDSKGYYNAIPATIKGIHYSYEYKVGTVSLYAEDRLGSNLNALDKDIKVKVTLTDADNGGN